MDTHSKIPSLFDILAFADLLAQEGLGSVAEQIHGIVCFVGSELHTATPGPCETQAPTASMAERVREALPTLKLPESSDFTLETLVLAKVPNGLWNPYPSLAELLHQRHGTAAYAEAIHRLIKTGFLDARSTNDRLAVEPLFVQHYLPYALKSFRLLEGRGKERAWLRTVFYRFALRELRIDRPVIAVTDMLKDIRDGNPSPHDALEAKQVETLGLELKKKLPLLPGDVQKALDLYFGSELDPKGQSFASIARKLSVSEYDARKWVIDGLSELAVRLGARDLFTTKEWRVMECIYVDRMEPLAAAYMLSIHLNEVRQHLAGAHEKFASVVRSRKLTKRGPGRVSDVLERQRNLNP